MAADDEWFAQLYEASYARLVVIAFGTTGSLADAEEVVQEAFLRTYARRSRVATVHNPEAWVCTVALNIARRRRRRQAMVDRLLLRRATDPTDPAAAGSHRDAAWDHDLLAAIAALPAQQRQVVVLHHLADLPIAEVALRVGVPEGTVKSRLARARTAAQDALTVTEPRGVADADLLQEADSDG